jgi:hypothetical protein
MPTSSPARGTAPTPAPFPQQQVSPQFQQPTFPQVPPQFRQPLPVNDDSNDDPAVPTPNPRGPIFNTFPQPIIAPQQPVPGVARPPAQVPVGVAVPGMVVPAPTQPGVPQPNQREP